MSEHPAIDAVRALVDECALLRAAAKPAGGSPPMDLLAAKICYADGRWAHFTTQELSQQWGDDWDDAPYEHNAGWPYEPRRPEDAWTLVRVAWDGPYDVPAEGHHN